MKENQKEEKDFVFLNVSDDSSNLDVICFSEVLENIGFELISNELYFFRITRQIIGDTMMYVVNNINKIEKLEKNNFSYRVSLEADKINYKKFKDILKNNLKGSNKLSFILINKNKEIEIESKDSFRVDLNFIDQLRSLDGIIDIKQIN